MRTLVVEAPVAWLTKSTRDSGRKSCSSREIVKLEPSPRMITQLAQLAPRVPSVSLLLDHRA